VDRELARDGVAESLRKGDAVKVSGRVKCRRVRVLPGGAGVGVLAYPGGGVGLDGVGRCGSLAECPVCARAECERRAVELQGMVRRYERDGGGIVYMVTVTAAHQWGDDLRELRSNVTAAWRGVWTGAPAARRKAALGVDGFVRALEVTHGRNGWHPHLHCLVFMRGELDAAGQRALGDWVFERWAKQCERRSMRPPERKYAVDVIRSCATRYVAKMGLVDEVAKGIAKRGKRGNRSPWQILADAAEAGRPADIAAWDAWCEGIRGARWLTWTSSLRKRWSYERHEQRPEPRLLAAYAPSAWDGLTYTQIANLLCEAESWLDEQRAPEPD
jgi:hypothetical protein